MREIEIERTWRQIYTGLFQIDKYQQIVMTATKLDGGGGDYKRYTLNIIQNFTPVYTSL